MSEVVNQGSAEVVSELERLRDELRLARLLFVNPKRFKVLLNLRREEQVLELAHMAGVENPRKGIPFTAVRRICDLRDGEGAWVAKWEKAKK